VALQGIKAQAQKYVGTIRTEVETLKNASAQVSGVVESVKAIALANQKATASAAPHLGRFPGLETESPKLRSAAEN
jgi:hypothetical protein